MNIKKLISTILAATITVGVCTHIAFGSNFVESLSTEIISAEVKMETVSEKTEFQDDETEMKAELADISFNGGLGTEDDPYLISTAEQLAMIDDSAENLKSCYRLTNDITLPSDWQSLDGAYEEIVVPSNPEASSGPVFDMDSTRWIYFSGVLDGAGYTITATAFYDVEESSRGDYGGYNGYDHMGMFVRNEGIIKNLNMHMDPTDKLYMPRYYAGLLCAYNAGTIKNCSVSGEFYYMGVYPASEYDFYQPETVVGGLVGVNTSIGRVENCSSTLSIRTDLNCWIIGGIVGYNRSYYESEKNIAERGIVENCYSTSRIVAFNSNNIGAIVGANEGIVNNVYSNAAIATNASKVGAIIGGNYENGDLYAIVANSYYYVADGAVGNNNIGTPVSLQELKTYSTFNGWDFVTTWGIDENINVGRPYLLSEVYGVNVKWPDFDVGKVENSFDEENRKVSVSTTVSNSEERSVPVNVIVAIYDENGVYRGQERVEMVLEPGKNTISVDDIAIVKYDSKKKYYGKVMVWDSMYGASPLSDAPMFEIK